MKFYNWTHWDIDVSKYFNPPPPKSPSQLTFFSNQMQQWITMTADDATKNVINWIHVFHS